MNDFLLSLVNKYRKKGILIDSNLLLLLVLGRYNRRLVGNDKRLAKYVPGDLDVLLPLVAQFEKIVTTPNILTEVSNLSDHMLATSYLQEFVRHIELMEEEYVASRMACREAIFSKVGLTDAVIAAAAQGRYLVLTDDLRLAGTMQKRSFDVINFNHIRMLGWS